MKEKALKIFRLCLFTSNKQRRTMLATLHDTAALPWLQNFLEQFSQQAAKQYTNKNANIAKPVQTSFHIFTQTYQ